MWSLWRSLRAGETVKLSLPFQIFVKRLAGLVFALTCGVFASEGRAQQQDFLSVQISEDCKEECAAARAKWSQLCPSLTKLFVSGKGLWGFGFADQASCNETVPSGAHRLWKLVLRAEENSLWFAIRLGQNQEMAQVKIAPVGHDLAHLLNPGVTEILGAALYNQLPFVAKRQSDIQVPFPFQPNKVFERLRKSQTAAPSFLALPLSYDPVSKFWKLRQEQVKSADSWIFPLKKLFASGELENTLEAEFQKHLAQEKAELQKQLAQENAKKAQLAQRAAEQLREQKKAEIQAEKDLLAHKERVQEIFGRRAKWLKVGLHGQAGLGYRGLESQWSAGGSLSRSLFDNFQIQIFGQHLAQKGVLEFYESSAKSTAGIKQSAKFGIVHRTVGLGLEYQLPYVGNLVPYLALGLAGNRLQFSYQNPLKKENREKKDTAQAWLLLGVGGGGVLFPLGDFTGYLEGGYFRSKSKNPQLRGIFAKSGMKLPCFMGALCPQTAPIVFDFSAHWSRSDLKISVASSDSSLRQVDFDLGCESVSVELGMSVTL